MYIPDPLVLIETLVRVASVSMSQSQHRRPNVDIDRPVELVVPEGRPSFASGKFTRELGPFSPVFGNSPELPSARAKVPGVLPKHPHDGLVGGKATATSLSLSRLIWSGLLHEEPADSLR